MASTTVYEYSSLSEYIEVARAHQGKRGKSSTRYQTDNSWTDGVNTFDAAARLCLFGWTDQHNHIKAIVDSITPNFTERMASRFETQYDVAGGMVDVAAYLNGEPECMVSFVDHETETIDRTLTIVVDGFYSAGTDTESIFKRGAAICALTEVLTLMGYAVKIVVESNLKGYNSSKDHARSVVTIKEHKADLAIDRIAFALCHPAFYRRIGFAWQEDIQGWNPEANSYSYPSQVSTPGDIIVGCPDYRDNITPEKNPLEWVKKMIAGIDLKHLAPVD